MFAPNIVPRNTTLVMSDSCGSHVQRDHHEAAFHTVASLIQSHRWISNMLGGMQLASAAMAQLVSALSDLGG